MTEGAVEATGSCFLGRPGRWFHEVSVSEGLPLGVVPPVFRHPVVACSADGGVCRVRVSVSVLNEIEALAVPGVVRHPFRVKVTRGIRHASLAVGQRTPRKILAMTLPTRHKTGHGTSCLLDLLGMGHGKIVSRLVN